MHGESTTKPRPSRLRRVLRSPWTQLLLALLALALLQGFVVKIYAVPSGSMEPTLHGGAGLNGDRILANRLAYAGAGPGRGDIVLFTAPHGWSPPVERSWLRTAAGWVGDATGIGPSNMNTLVKRVIAVGGDTLSCCSADGRVLLNGSPIHERYVVSDLPFEPGVLDCASTPASLRCLPEIAVPERSLLVMGDNRPASSDSVFGCRSPDAVAPGCVRFVPESDVVGELWIVVWPLNRFGAP